MGVPRRSNEQRAEALAQAQRVRQIHAQVKQMLKTGELGLAELLSRADSSDELARMRVSAVLQAMPRIGPVRSRRLMEGLDIAASRRLGGLGPRQRAGMLDELG